ncbi:hypothetical protein M5K25_016306 [Dendrobium thyrsiflorum]|uniref:Uncharacterized protein n=1 Tax=Dendrobium thyrsiflorum TaxID=117978 RepID=A0ABD0UR61_DENTH
MKQKPSSSLKAKASDTKAIKWLGQEAKKKYVERKKASSTLPKATTTPKERKHVPHLGSNFNSFAVFSFLSALHERKRQNSVRK